jgi:hypothetical protein
MTSYTATLPNGITVSRNSTRFLTHAAVAEQPGVGWYLCGMGGSANRARNCTAARVADSNGWEVRVVVLSKEEK